MTRIRKNNGFLLMKGSIAWIRLMIYSGASALLLIEVYRVFLILLTLIIIAPQTMLFFQNLIIWGIFIGFGLLSIGFYKLLKSYPPLLDIKEYPIEKIRSSTSLGVFLSILIGMLLILPPLTYVSTNYQLIFSFFTSILWFIFYFVLSLWILFYWKLTNEISVFSDVVKNLKKGIHITLVLIISGFWLTDIFSWFLMRDSIFTYDFINILYIIFVLLFSFNQILFFFNVRKISYLIYG